LLSSIQLSDAMESLLSSDIMAPNMEFLLSKSHLLALNERIKTIIAIIEICFDIKSKHEVLK
jgi:hypothetical protein